MATWQAFAIALWVGLVQSRSLFGGASTTLRFTPLMTGLVCGIVLGNVSEAMKITAAIQLIYMGVFSPGGQMPSEPAIAAAVAVPVALMTNLDPEAAVGIAVPFGLLGSYLYQFRFFINTFVLKITDKHAANADHRGLTRSIIIYPIIVSLLIFVPFMFLVLKYGAPVIADVVEQIAGGRIFHVLSVIGGGLASIGIALTVYVIGKRNYIAFFVLAYFIAVMLRPLGINMATYAIVGALVAFIYVLVRNESVAKMKE